MADDRDTIYYVDGLDVGGGYYYHDKTDALEMAFDLALEFARGDVSMVEFLRGGERHEAGYLLRATREENLMGDVTESDTARFAVREYPIE